MTEKLTVDYLIKSELEGKTSAIIRYDEMIWRIRTGYAILLYGAIGIIFGLVNQKAITLTPTTMLSAVILITGFSVFGALLDYCFISAKLRVVEYRDQLIQLAFSKATASFCSSQNDELVECLKNSGERNKHINWTKRVGRLIPLMYYGGTGSICSLSVYMLVT